MAYLLDANVFIQAKNLHYGFDFCSAFWDWLLVQSGQGKVFSVEKVGDELQAGSDDLTNWAAARGPGFFLPPDPDMLTSLSKVSAWVTREGFDPAAASTFFQVADYYLVAFVLAHGHVVVTHEQPSPSLRKVKIPTACIGLGIKCMSPFEMLRKEKARFDLRTR